MGAEQNEVRIESVEKGIVMAKLTPEQKARAKEMSKKRGVKYPNAWANLAVARGKKKK